MKKNIFWILVLCMVVFSACAKDDDKKETTPSATVPIETTTENITEIETTTPVETTPAPKEDEVPVQTGGADGEPVEIKAKYIFYNGKLYTFSNEHFLQRTEKDFLEKWPDYKHIGYVAKEDSYTIPSGEFEACGLKEGSKVYINPYDDKYIVVYDDFFWKMKISRQ